MLSIGIKKTDAISKKKPQLFCHAISHPLFHPFFISDTVGKGFRV
jgi:hypothetical protein